MRPDAEHYLHGPEAEQRFAQRMSAGIGVPCTLVVPYALFIYYGLDRGGGPLSSFAALLIAIGSSAYLSGSLIGTLNAQAVLRLGSRAWFYDAGTAQRSATVAVCAFFVAVAAAIASGHPLLIAPALAAPAMVAAVWLAVTGPKYPVHF